jgi:predicted nuclease with RNAse H fold
MIDSQSITVAGIDVGGKGKGFHAAVMRNGILTARAIATAQEAADWCVAEGAQVVAVDAPMGWSVTGRSRQAERELKWDGVIIQCFRTPDAETGRTKAFYGWVWNGMELYDCLAHHYRRYDGMNRAGEVVFETFPNAVACALAGRVIPAKPKRATRRGLLQAQGLDDSRLKNIDEVDAALCALTAVRFTAGRTVQFGNAAEGFIVIPS